MTNQLNLFPVDSPANHILTLGSKEARKMTVTSGKNISELYKRSDQPGLLAKMFLESSIWNSTKCFLTWRVRTTPINRLLFQLVPSTPHIEGIEFGLLPSPRAREGNAGKPGSVGSIHNAKRGYLDGVVQEMWATPNAMDHLPQRSPEALHRLATTHRKGRTRPSNLREQVNEETMKMWPTPTRREYKGGRKLETLKAKGRTATNTLCDAVNAELGRTGTLNPNWVEWLMGYPIGWTDLKD